MRFPSKWGPMSALNWLNAFILLSLALLYMGGGISPTQTDFVWAFNFIIPFALIFNIVLLIMSLAFRKTLVSVLYLFLLIIGSNYLLGSVGIKSFFKDKVKESRGFSVINYNVSSFYTLNTELWANLPPNDRAMEMKKWILGNNADIQCYQEFMNSPGHPEFDLIRKLENNGYHVFFSESAGQKHHQVGMLIASKFPIVDSGDVSTFKANHYYHFNRIMYADLRIQNDTIRVINFHLASMALKSHNPLQKANFEDVVYSSKTIIDKLKDGVMDRSRQVEDMILFIRNSPYPVICIGDFNDLPYTYAYQEMRKVMSNAFEERGRGFGFTYNGNILRTLRIDNQFYSNGIVALEFETLDKVIWSDHYPIKGRYELEHN